jgi:hypothetical protein
MSEAKFTDGPWSVIENSVGSIEVVFGGGSPCRGSEYLCIAPLSAKNDNEEIHSGETALSNAHLIAAAPEMYEMLEMLSGQLTDINAHHAAKEIDELLAKARGDK